ncbi:MAG: cell wall hydrolase [Pseudomonadota bacterium]
MTVALMLRASGVMSLVCVLMACGFGGSAKLETAEAPPARAISAQLGPSGAAAGFAPDALACLREAIYYEARPDSPKGQRAVADVIFNRKADPRFPNTVCDVIAEGEAEGRCQFSYRCDGRAEMFGDTVKYQSSTRAAEAALATPEADVTGGALFFHGVRMAPGWFGTLDRTVELGGHYFYRG